MARKNRHTPFDTPFAEEQTASPHTCAHEGCDARGDYLAPKSRKDGDYQWLCYDHVCLHNKQWNYFAGCSASFIEKFQRDSLIGMRPTWRFGTHRMAPHINLHGWTPWREKEIHSTLPAKTQSALSLFSLTPSCNKNDVKRRYRHLVKLHHPDKHQGDKHKERKMSSINDAYHHLLHFVDYGIRGA